jgi:spiro-SPASM protein
MDRNHGRMDLEIYKKLIDEVAFINSSRGIRVRDDISIDFSLYGEPLNHPDFLEMLKYLKEKLNLKYGCPPVYIYTNGLELSPEISKLILEMNLEGIIFSLDAVDGNSYKEIKGQDAYEQVLENISNLIRSRNQLKYGSRPRVGIQILKIKETEDIIDEFYKNWTEGALKYENLSLNNACVPIIGHFSSFCGQIQDRSVIDVTPLKRFPCKRLLGSLSVYWNGDVVMCPQDFNGKFIIGNVKEKNLEQIWNSPELKRLREDHINDQYDSHPLCKDCKEWYLPF